MMGQRGFGAIAAIIVLVLLAALAAGIVSLGTTQQMTAAQDLLSARALQAANAGAEMGLYRALAGDWAEGGGADICPAAGAEGHGAAAATTLDLAADTGFHVAVSADCWRYKETRLDAAGAAIAATTAVYQIRAVACTSAACPDDAAAVTPGYVERSKVVIATN